MNVADGAIKALMNQYKKFVVYGLSPNPDRSSHSVPTYMREQGWEMVGTYPQEHQAGGFQIFRTLAQVPPEYRKFVDVFRRSEDVPKVVDEVLAVGGVEVLWLQLGIAHPEAEARAERAGIKVVSNRCLVIEHRRWF